MMAPIILFYKAMMPERFLALKMIFIVEYGSNVLTMTFSQMLGFRILFLHLIFSNVKVIVKLVTSTNNVQKKFK